MKLGAFLTDSTTLVTSLTLQASRGVSCTVSRTKGRRSQPSQSTALFGAPFEKRRIPPPPEMSKGGGGGRGGYMVDFRPRNRTVA